MRTMDRTVRLILRTLQPPRGRAWHGGPTPVAALRGVSAAEARRRPRAGRHSIWELALHVAYWKYAVRRRLTGAAPGGFPRSPANWPAVPARPGEAAWRRDRALLVREHRLLLDAVARLDAKRLGRRPVRGERWTLEEEVIGILAHDVYHAGQIQLLKRTVRRR
jgi:uncharacterized damage-inducible protein DinB